MEPLFHTDNTAVRDALISCNSSNQVAKGLLISVLALECIQQVTPWYARVPSNMSDNPSRLETTRLTAIGAQHDPLKTVGLSATLMEQWGEERAAHII